MKTARPSTTGWLSLSETEDELESLSSVYTVTHGTGAGGVGWFEAEAGRYLGKRCGSLRDMTTLVFCQQSGRDQRAKIIPLEAAEDGWSH